MYVLTAQVQNVDITDVKKWMDCDWKLPERLADLIQFYLSLCKVPESFYQSSIEP